MKNLINLILGLLVTIFISGNTFGQSECIEVSGTGANYTADYTDTITLSMINNLPNNENGSVSLNTDNTCLIINDFTIGNNNSLYRKLDSNLSDTVTVEYFMSTNKSFLVFTDINNNIIFVISKYDDFLVYHKIQTESLSITDNNEIEFAIYPNPTSDFINIKTDEWSVETSILDMNGNIVINSTDKQIDIRDLPQGIYFVSVNNGKPKRIIKN